MRFPRIISLLLLIMSANAPAALAADELKYAAYPLAFDDIRLEIDEEKTVTIEFRNEGSVAVANLNYQVTIDGITAKDERITFSDRISIGNTGSFSFTLKGDKRANEKELVVAITHVNGHDNELKDEVAIGKFLTTNGGLRRNLVVEEFTGTHCGYCPRGMAAMEVMREAYGNRFVGIAIHGFNNDDPMYLLPSRGDYAYIFGGSAPSLQLNRSYGEIDPRRGTSTDVLIDCENELAKPITAGVFLEAKFNADSTQVEAVATIEGVEDGRYTIEYVLVGDSLEGSGQNWWQDNYYYSYSQGSLTSDMDKFCRGGEYGENPIRNWVYNDVALVSSYKNKQNQATVVGEVKAGENVENTYTLTIPTSQKLAPFIRKDQLWVMAILVYDSDDAELRDKVANGAKARVLGDETIVDAIDYQTANNAPEQSCLNIYDLNGRKVDLQQMQKGVYIKNGRKVVIK